MPQLHLIYEDPPPPWGTERRLDVRSPPKEAPIMVRSKMVMMASLEKSPDSPRKRQDEH
ncbi:hypothetical protein PISMIDRAFT_685661 [Pisolithus microcarpus 441]|uniref:Uncharacterized protein n=1 Tax=Pisolithus microcarpus 441 TaxID=765257 RepID=A0A0C9YSX2_9AGAM|nr:hypothetical protein PISMIDRAFT_685661 [Pisolithus microcarpus 441]